MPVATAPLPPPPPQPANPSSMATLAEDKTKTDNFFIAILL
jgi:hypothetical protein